MRMGQRHLSKLCIILLIASSINLIKDVATNPGADEVPPDDLEYCDFNDTENGQGDETEAEVSFCQEVMAYDNSKLYNQDDYNILAALGTSVLNKTYPSRVNTTRAFITFDELPYPVPTGATSYFMVLLTVIFTWYFTKFLHWLFKDMVKQLDLFPVTDSFPNVNIYTLQQSRRESRLNRDARNTWSWLATYYMLKPNDKDVNPDEVFRTSGWDDFRVPHDVWYIIKAVLRMNAVAVSKKKERKKLALESASDPTGLAHVDRKSYVTLDSDQNMSSDNHGGASHMSMDPLNRIAMLRNLLEHMAEEESEEAQETENELERTTTQDLGSHQNSHTTAAFSVHVRHPPIPSNNSDI